MGTLKDRIKEFIAYKGMNTSSFEKSIPLSNGSVSKMGDNTRRSTIDSISKVFPELNINWLLTGDGEMLKKDTDSVIIPISDTMLINQRIKKVVDYSGESIKDFASKLGITQQSFDNCIDGGEIPSFDIIYRLLNGYPMISAEWLLRGKGDMIVGTPTEINEQIKNSAKVLYTIMNDRKVDDKFLAQLMGMSSLYDFNSILNEKRNFEINEIIALHNQYPNYSLAWLMGYSDEMYSDEVDTIQIVKEVLPPNDKELEKENTILKTRLEEKNEQIQFLKELINK